MKQLKLAAIGCGGRTFTYMELAGKMPDKYEIVAGADPIAHRVQRIKKISHNPDFQSFKNDKEILAQNKLADVMIIGTQDAYHYEPCKNAMEKGYDVLLEKPIADTLEKVIDLNQTAEKLKRKVVICHVLRYSPFFVKVKELVNSGIIGDIITLNEREGIGPWHFSHSFVRGYWSVMEKSTPTIIAKSCHDMDIISWIIRKKCLNVSSYGELTHFTEKNAPKGAPSRCTDGCPVENTCIYNAIQYTNIHKDWLYYILDKIKEKTATRKKIIEWLSQSPWGRCVYRCDNTALDHQVVILKFEGDITATFTMTAFEPMARYIEIFGTKGTLKGGESFKKKFGSDIIVEEFKTNKISRYDVNYMVGGYEGHGGGDPALMIALYSEMMKHDPKEMVSSISNSVESHVMGFAAEESRLTTKTIDLKK